VRPLYRREGGGWTTIRPDDGGGVAGTLLLHVDGPIYTGNAQVTVDAVVAAARDAVPPVQSVVLEASAVHGVTVPMLDALRSLQQELATQGFPLRLAGVPPETLEVCRRDAWFADAEASGLVFATVDDAIAAHGRSVE
jgi:MFS superfamily sulfate permease-like transporter